jgi:hypothetical protein
LAQAFATGDLDAARLVLDRTEDWRPGVAAVSQWWADLQRRYPEPPPTSGDPDELEEWSWRGLRWARSVDPEGAEAAMTLLLEDMVQRGELERHGVAASGRIVYQTKRGADPR